MHEQTVALQCDADMRVAAQVFETDLPEHEQYYPSLSNARMPFLPEGVDIMELYRCVLSL